MPDVSGISLLAGLSSCSMLFAHSTPRWVPKSRGRDVKVRPFVARGAWRSQSTSPLPPRDATLQSCLSALARQSRRATLLLRLHLCWMPGFAGATWWPGVTKRSWDLERGGKAYPSGMPDTLGKSLVWLACIWPPREAESRERAAGACNGMSPPTCLVLHCPNQDE